jgi:hypothetical protein
MDGEIFRWLGVLWCSLMSCRLVHDIFDWLGIIHWYLISFDDLMSSGQCMTSSDDKMLPTGVRFLLTFFMTIWWLTTIWYFSMTICCLPKTQYLSITRCYVSGIQKIVMTRYLAGDQVISTWWLISFDDYLFNCRCPIFSNKETDYVWRLDVVRLLSSIFGN